MPLADSFVAENSVALSSDRGRSFIVNGSKKQHLDLNDHLESSLKVLKDQLSKEYDLEYVNKLIESLHSSCYLRENKNFGVSIS